LKNEKTLDSCIPDEFYQDITVIDIDDFPEIKRLDGRFVQVEGTLSFNFEDVAIYPFGSNDPNKAYWVEFRLPGDSAMEYVNTLNEKRVTLVGRMNLKAKGHMNSYRGTIDSVFCIK
jgi:hypothetical protein